jgi:hypothetical protein
LPAQAQSAQVLMPAEADSFALGGTSI